MSTRLLAFLLCTLVFAADKTGSQGKATDGKPATAATKTDPRKDLAEKIIPGATVTIEFPELTMDRHGAPATCDLSLPASYDVAKKYPLVVWLGGGDGGNKPSRSFLPEGEFVTVGLPYPKGANNPAQANMVGEFSKIWSYHRAMLEAIRKAIPNLDPKTSILAGFSNGGHAVDGMLRAKTAGAPLTDYFGLFVFADGGGTDYTSKGNLPTLAGKHAYLCWGEKSPNNKPVQKLAKEMKSKGTTIIASEMKGVGHTFTESEQVLVKAWIEKTLASPRR